MCKYHNLDYYNKIIIMSQQTSLSNIKIYIVDKQREVVNSLQKHFEDVKNIEVVRGDLESIKDVDCIVAGNNSYGLMDNGADKQVNLLLNNIEPHIRYVIESQHCGELPVGSSIIMKTNNASYRYIAYCPTMRLSKDVSDTHNAYHSFRGLLCGVLNHNRNNSDNQIRSVLCTGFCTGHGKMDPERAGKQMRLAYGFVSINMKCSIENAKIIDKLLK